MNSRPLISIPCLIGFLLLGLIVSGFWIRRADGQETGSEKNASSETSAAETSTATKDDSSKPGFGKLTAFVGATIETAGKAGRLKNATLLVRDDVIQAVGTDIEIPVSARVIDVSGKTIFPGVIDPYFVVSVPRSVAVAEPRTIVFGGRTFVIGGGSTPESTDFLRIADGFDVRKGPWSAALRSGITTPHLVTSGYGQSIIARTTPEQEDKILENPDGTLFLAASTRTDSLKVLRDGLKEDKKAQGGDSANDALRARIMAMRAARGSRGGSSGAGAGGSGSGAQAAAAEKPPEKISPTQALWNDVKSGKRTLFINANNAAAILHVLEIVKESDKAKIVLVADGSDLYQARAALADAKVSIVLRPRLETIPDNATRLNMAKELQKMNKDFAFSLSLNQGDYNLSQDTPLFPIAMLVRSGLDSKAALEALTLTPAKMLGQEKSLGSLEENKRANLIIFDSDPLSTMARIEQVFVEGSLVYEND